MKSLSQFRYRAPLTKATERELILASQRGEEAPQVELQKMFHLYLVQLCRRFTGGWMGADDSEDILSEARLALQEAIRTFDVNRGVRFATWLRLLVRRFVLAYVEKRTRLAGPDLSGTVCYETACASHFSSEPVPSHEDGGMRVLPDASFEATRGEVTEPGVEVARRDLLDRVRAIVLTWDPSDRLLFVNRVENRMKFHELAKFLPPGGPTGRRAASLRFRRLRNELREKLS